MVNLGCYVETAHGEAVVVSIPFTTKGGLFSYRYEARRCADGATLWVLSSGSPDEVIFLRGPDAESRRVRALKGPYGLD